ncbi:MAG: threonine--tRNA ligase [Bacteriovoracaceae bacterium]|nr:threonine--tRNA ligase [Bacteriovoracaceae bacterium]
MNNKFDLDTIRHSCAHLMAQAIQELFPNEEVQLGIGPVIEHGFYYDIDMKTRLSEEDLKNVEAKMAAIIEENLPIVRKEISREEAVKLFTKMGQTLKVELIKDLPANEVITCYSTGGEDRFIDLCRGPHVENTKQISQHFKLLHTAGAYWRGDEKRPMLQRVYAACFDDRKKLKEHLTFLEEAKKRDHRKLGTELELFHFDPVAPGSPFFMPKGTIVYNGLIDFIRRMYLKYDYKEVITPQILDVELWHTSGHYENYKENMFFTPIENREFAVKPMNCPCHMLMYRHYQYSYRDLPLRFADFGRLHRYEKSGTLAGLTRVRTFCQDDCHIFLPISEITAEVQRVMETFFIIYKHFGFKNIKLGVSTRPAKKIGSDEVWDQAEQALMKALDSAGHPYTINEGDGAFYGPKIDILISDAIGRYHQLGTCQLDFHLPERFDLRFTNQNGEMERPVVIHRALLGSLERFFGVYLEHVAGVFPFWLAPEQMVIVPVNNAIHLEHAQKLNRTLTYLGYRTRVDDRNESMGYKTRQIQKGKIPFMIVIGDREMESNSVSIRKYGENFSKTLSWDELQNLLGELSKEKDPIEMR